MADRAWIAFGLLAVNMWAATPFIDSVYRPSAAVGWGPLSITISGANFAPSATVNFGGLKLNPDSLTSSRIGVTVPYTALTHAATVNLTVVNPGTPGSNGLSNVVAFPIANQSLSVSTTRKVYAMSEPIAVLTDDFNADGKPDLAVANWCSTGVSSCRPGTVNILLGDGSGNLTQSFSMDAGAQPTAVAAGDFNNDGKNDLAVVSTDHRVSIFLGDGTGHFRATYFSLGPPNIGSLDAVAAGDFNSDGNLDLIIAGAANGPFLLLGDGAGNFTSGPSPAAEGGGTSIALGDFNSDGRLDVAIAYFYSTNVTLLLGDGAGRFRTSMVPVGFSARAVAAGDFDGDGALDLAVASLFGNKVIVLLGDGSGNFTAASSTALSNGPVSIALADLNGDHKLDLVVASQSGGLSVLLGDGTGRFNATPAIAAGNSPVSVAMGDFNEDGSMDIAVASANDGVLSVFLQNAPPPPRILYSIQNVCPVPCTLTALSDSGVVAGPDFAIYPDTGYVDFIQRTGQRFYPYAINKAGVIVGQDGFQNTCCAAAWVPQIPGLLELDSVFGWPQGRATFVNNRGEIVGDTYPDTVDGLIPGISLANVDALTDNGIVLGNDSRGAGAVYAPGVGVFRLPITVNHGNFNTAGQMLLSAPEIGQFFTAGSGVTVLPAAPSFTASAFNEVGVFVGATYSYPAGFVGYLYTASGGLVRLDTLLAPGSGWTITVATAVNNNGQILALATKDGVSTYVLMAPYLETFVATARP